MQQNQNLSSEEKRSQAMSDPEVQEILRDPAMRMILEQMQENPAAASEYVAQIFSLPIYYFSFLLERRAEFS